MDNSIWPGWRTVRKIGTGSYGTVYEIERDVFGEQEKAALKVISIPRNQYEVEELRNEGFDDDNINIRFDSYLKDIVHEYSLMAKMKGNSNTVYCDDIKYERNEDGIGWKIYIKMELLTPLVKTLHSVSDDRQVLKLAHDICGALVMCRQFNIVHRDIKPQNIFVAKDGTFKLGDFGIAKTSDRTTSGTVIGTYKYMAPEVYNNQPYGSGADIYSLGIVLYWLLNERRTPFLLLPPKVPTAAMEEDARRRRFLGEAIPAPKNGSPALKEIVLKACAYDVNDRYGSAAEMLAAIDRVSKAYESASGVPSEEPPVKTEPELWIDPGAESQSELEQSALSFSTLAETEIESRLDTSLQTSPLIMEHGQPTVVLKEPAEETTPVAAVPSAPEREQAPAKEAGNQGFFFLPKKAKKEAAAPKPPASEPEDAVRKSRKRNRTTQTEDLAQKETDATAELNAQDGEKEKKKKLTGYVAIAAGLVAVLLCAILLFSGRNTAKTIQADWTQWSDDLPETVTAEDYSIEERTLYSTRQLETTQSTQSDRMDGWELYDTAEGNGEFGAWSVWTEKEQKATDTKQVETQLRYRYREKETAESDSNSMPGWTLENTTTEWGDYGAWSSWSQTAVSGSDSRQVQTQTQYRYRNKETTTSSSSSLAGWTSDGSTTTGGDWGAWSAWSTTPVSSSSTTEVETKTQYSYREKSYTTSTSSYLNGWTQYGSPTVDYGTFSAWSETPVSASDSIDVETKEETTETEDGVQRQMYYRYRQITRTYQFYKWSGWSEYSDTPVSGNENREVTTRQMYRSRTRTQATTTYKYYRWTSWSSWSASPVSRTSTREVQTQTLYRYRDRTGVSVYHFYRWKNWSAWSETKVEQTDDRKVETKTFYRFRERVTETTYYFRRWTDWTEYGEQPAEPGEDLEVQTKTQYRYRSKESEGETT